MKLLIKIHFLENFSFQVKLIFTLSKYTSITFFLYRVTYGPENKTQMDEEKVDFQSVLDLSKKSPEVQPVGSPILMPPPVRIPKCPPQVNVQKSPVPPINNGDSVLLHQKQGSKFVTNCVDNTKEVTGNNNVRCFVPKEDIVCSITNNNNRLDSNTKKLVHYQISQKIYSQPQKRITMVVKEENGSDVLPLERKGLKIHSKHFKEKSVTVDDIDLDSLKRPMRSSTPTPSICESTIVAGHLDLSNQEQAEVETTTEVNEGSSDNSKEIFDPRREKELDDIFDDYSTKCKGQMVQRKRKNYKKRDPDTANVQQKNNYCKTWMQKQDGISTNNWDAPPSLYASSVALSDSLLNITSVSRNVSPNITPGKDTKQGRGITGKDYSNTVFM